MKRKVSMILLVVCFLFSMTSCKKIEFIRESIVDEHPEKNNESVTDDSIDDAQSTDNYHEEPAGFLTDYKPADFENYNSPATENGHGGDKIYISGKLDEVSELADGNNSFLGIVHTEEDDEWLVVLDYKTDSRDKSFYNDIVGHKIIVAGIYEGYSSVYEMPSIFMNKMWDNDEGIIVKSLALSDYEWENFKTKDHIVFISSFSSNLGDRKWLETYDYDDNGVLLSQRTYDSPKDGTLTDYIYDDYGKMIKEKYYLIDQGVESLYRVTDYQYNDQDQLIMETCYIDWFEDDGELFYTLEHQYDSAGLEICSIQDYRNYDHDDVEYNEYDYNSRGRLEKKTEYEMDRKTNNKILKRTTTYEYNDLGILTYETNTSYHNNEVYTSTVEHKYDENNNLVESNTVSEYDGVESVYTVNYEYCSWDGSFDILQEYDFIR